MLGDLVMAKKERLTPLAIAIGTVAITMTTSQAVNAHEDPFTMKELSSGYMVAGSHKKKDEKTHDEKHDEGKCGCGGAKASENKDGEGKCGEGKCGEGKCGEGKDGEGKCGEGTCGN